MHVLGDEGAALGSRSARAGRDYAMLRDGVVESVHPSSWPRACGAVYPRENTECSFCPRRHRHGSGPVALIPHARAWDNRSGTVNRARGGTGVRMTGSGLAGAGPARPAAVQQPSPAATHPRDACATHLRLDISALPLARRRHGYLGRPPARLGGLARARRGARRTTVGTEDDRADVQPRLRRRARIHAAHAAATRWQVCREPLHRRGRKAGKNGRRLRGWNAPESAQACRRSPVSRHHSRTQDLQSRAG